MKKNNLFSVIFLLCFGSFFGQLINPVQVTSVVVPPSSLYLADYTTNTDNWRVNFKFLDFNAGSREVKLKLKISSSNLTLETNDFTSSQNSFVIFAGELISLSGFDLEPYLNTNNVNLSGITKQQLRNGRLPEGFYEFCAEVRDATTNEVLSEQQSCQSVWLQLNDAPILNFPSNGQILSDNDGSIFNFQWQQANISSLNSFDPQYQLSVYEILDPQLSAEGALSSNQIQFAFQTEWSSSTNYLLGIDNLALKTGTKYIAYVQVKDDSGRDTYKNNGFSEIVWFFYGHPENGGVELTQPEHYHVFDKYEDQEFKWNTPDNLVGYQTVDYELVITELNEGQTTTDAISQNEIWYQEFINGTDGSQDWSFKLRKLLRTFKKGQQYVWKIYARVDNKQIAESNVNIFYGPPIIENFYVGNKYVTITSLDNGDLTNLKGTGTFFLDEAQNQKVEGRFDGIGIRASGSQFYLNRGEVVADLLNDYTISLAPNEQINGEANFKASKARLGYKQGLDLYGQVEWDYPLILDNQVTFTTEETWLDYPEDELTGKQDISSEVNLELAFPDNFQLTIFENSEVSIVGNVYYLHLDGEVKLREEIEGSTDGIRPSYSFTNQSQINYITSATTLETNHIRLFDGLDAFIEPTQWVIDFSEERSDADHEKDWMGLSIPRFNLTLNSYRATGANFKLNAKAELSFTNKNEMTASVDALGLQSKIKLDVRQNEIKPKFNTFPSKLKSIQLEVIDGSVTESEFKGAFQVPFLSTTEEFEYVVPVDESGFRTAYLSDKFDGKKFYLNEALEAQKIEIVILKAVFEGSSKLNIDCSLKWGGMDIEIPFVDNLTIWGNYNVGFGEINGSQYLQSPIVGDLSGYRRTTKTIGVGRDKNLYAFALVSEIDYGEDVAGADGAPTINSYSTFKSPLIPEQYRLSSLSYQEEMLITLDKDLFKTEDGEVVQVDIAEEEGILDLAFAELEDEQEFNGEIEFEMTDKGKVYSPSEFTSSESSEDKEVHNVTLEDVIKILDVFIELSQDEQRKKKAEEIKEFLTGDNVEDAKEVWQTLAENDFSINKLLKLLSDKIGMTLSGKVTSKIDSVNKKMHDFVNGNVDTVMVRLFDKLDPKFETLRERIVNSFEEEKRVSVDSIVRNAVRGVKNGTRIEVSNALKKSVHDNVTGKIELFINKNLKDKVDFYIREKVNEVGYALIDGNLKEVDYSSFVSDGQDVIKEFGDTLFMELKTIKGDKITSTLESIGQDFVNNISWQNLSVRISKEVLGKSAELFVVEKISKEITKVLGSGVGGEFVGSLASNVQLNFNDLGRNLREENIKDVVKFDVSNITVKTKVASFSGSIKLYKDDPEWGDCFKGNITGELKKPAKISVKAVYINGKVRGTKFWYIELAVPTGLDVPLTPGLNLDGIGGKVFSKMSYDIERKDYFPDPKNKYGAGLDMYCIDAGSGNMVKLKVSAELTFMQDYYTLQIRGDIGVAFKGSPSSRPNFSKSASIVGSGHITFNSRDKTLIGFFEVDANLKPIICINGTLDFIISEDVFELNIGRRERPVVAKPLCLIKFESYLMISKQEFELALMSDVNLSAKTPWFNITKNTSVQAYAEFGFYLDALVNVQFKPNVKLQEARLELEVTAGIGVDWQRKSKEGRVELVGIYLHGKALYINTAEKAVVSGSLSGRVKVLLIEYGVDLNVNRDLRKSA